eukprot:TRINITY_DN36588_c0_g1_i2.p1 TRINITY_DN36588_c0_g1~~TRINITY_DN36588_c0_g1_i2.p1  ORF type:complete len:612 (-),score=66.98 TRINITY_DN36588_c0_g1_i2:163-1998(-)
MSRSPSRGSLRQRNLTEQTSNNGYIMRSESQDSWTALPWTLNSGASISESNPPASRNGSRSSSPTRQRSKSVQRRPSRSASGLSGAKPTSTTGNAGLDRQARSRSSDSRAARGGSPRLSSAGSVTANAQGNLLPVQPKLCVPMSNPFYLPPGTYSAKGSDCDCGGLSPQRRAGMPARPAVVKHGIAKSQYRSNFDSDGMQGILNHDADAVPPPVQPGEHTAFEQAHYAGLSLFRGTTETKKVGVEKAAGKKAVTPGVMYYMYDHQPCYGDMDLSVSETDAEMRPGFGGAAGFGSWQHRRYLLSPKDFTDALTSGFEDAGGLRSVDQRHDPPRKKVAPTIVKKNVNLEGPHAAVRDPSRGVSQENLHELLEASYGSGVAGRSIHEVEDRLKKRIGGISAASPHRSVILQPGPPTEKAHTRDLHQDAVVFGGHAGFASSGQRDVFRDMGRKTVDMSDFEADPRRRDSPWHKEDATGLYRFTQPRCSGPDALHSPSLGVTTLGCMSATSPFSSFANTSISSAYSTAASAGVAAAISGGFSPSASTSGMCRAVSPRASYRGGASPIRRSSEKGFSSVAKSLSEASARRSLCYSSMVSKGPASRASLSQSRPVTAR